MASETDIRTLAQVLDWYQAVGVDTSTATEATNWIERGDAPPGHGFRMPFVTDEPGRAEATAAGNAADAKKVAEPRAAMVARQVAPAGLTSTPSKTAPSTPAARSVAAMPALAPGRQFTGTAPDAAELGARAAARNAKTLVDLETALAAFDGCGLKATAKNLCFYRGAERARIMIIGEAPGRDEDIAGKPFVGRAGQLLDKMLAAIGLDEARVHITNIVYWRPPGNRTPTPQEGQVCRPFLERQVELVEPEIVLLLGGAAAKHVLDTAEGIMRLRGKWREANIGGRSLKTLATLHPAYLLRTPAAKRLAWRDLQAIRAHLDGSGPAL